MSLTDKLIKILESKSEEIAKTWCRYIKDSQYAPTFRTIPREKCFPIAGKVYRDLVYWLRDPEHDLRGTYEKFGESLYYMGVGMEEAVMVLVLIKRHLWLHMLERGIMASDLDVYQTLALNNRVVLYFDRAIYHSLVGFKQAKAEDTAAPATT